MQRGICAVVVAAVLTLAVCAKVARLSAFAGDGAASQSSPEAHAMREWSEMLQKSGAVTALQDAIKAEGQGNGQEAVRVYRRILENQNLDPTVALFVRMMALGSCFHFGYISEMSALASEGLAQASDVSARRVAQGQPETSYPTGGDWRFTTMSIAAAVILYKEDASKDELTDAQRVIDTGMRALPVVTVPSQGAAEGTAETRSARSIAERVLRGRIASARAAARIGYAAEAKRALASALADATDPLIKASAAYNLGKTELETGEKQGAAGHLQQALQLLKGKAPKEGGGWEIVVRDIERLLGELGPAL